MIVIESKVFSKRLIELAGDAEDSVLRQIQEDLLENPIRGNVVPGLGGIRKARIANPRRGKGKRGGFRCMFLHIERRHHIHLLFLLGKDEQEDLSETERRQLRQLVAQLK